jgi:hypothetical protein
MSQVSGGAYREAVTPADSLREALASAAREVLRAASPGGEELQALLDRPGDLLPDLTRLVPGRPTPEELAVFALVHLCELGNTAQDVYRLEARAFPAADGWARAIGVALVPESSEPGIAPPAATLQLAVFGDGGLHGVRLHLTEAVELPSGQGPWKVRLEGDAGAGVDIPLQGAWAHRQGGTLEVAVEYTLPAPPDLDLTRIHLGTATLTLAVAPSATPWWTVDLALEAVQAAIADDLLDDLRSLLNGAVDVDLPRFDYAPRLHVDSNAGSTTLVLH